MAFNPRQHGQGGADSRNHQFPVTIINPVAIFFQSGFTTSQFKYRHA